MIESPGESPHRVTEGHVVISWALPGEADGGTPPDFVLEQASTPEFSDAVVRYEGRDLASFLSGLPEGRFHFRVRAVDGGNAGPWSVPLVLDVDYPKSGMVLVLMTVGTVCLAVLITAILVGARRTSARSGND